MKEEDKNISTPQEEFEDQLKPGLGIGHLRNRDVKKLARKIAGTSDHPWQITANDIVSGNAVIVGKHTRQEDRFKRIFNKQYAKNKFRSEQIANIEAAKQGDVDAFKNYITNTTNKAAPYTLPLILGPTASMMSSSGLFTSIANLGKTAYSIPAIKIPVETALTADAVRNAASDNGVKKTIKLINEGDYWGALGSGIADVADAAGVLGSVQDAYRYLFPKKLKASYWQKKMDQSGDVYEKLNDQIQAANQKRANLYSQFQALTPPELRAEVIEKSRKIPKGTSTHVDVQTYRLPNQQNIPIQVSHQSILADDVDANYLELNTNPEEPIIARKIVSGATFKDQPVYYGPSHWYRSKGIDHIPIATQSNPVFIKYLDDAQRSIGDAGTIMGSSLLYKNRYISGVPHDLEIITTQSRLPQLKVNAGFTQTDVLPNAITGKSKIAGGEGAMDIQVIGSNKRGNATGKLAHEIYRVLYPKEYAKYISNAVQNNPTSRIGSVNLPLPKLSGGYYTPDELFTEFSNNGLAEKKTLIDALLVSKTGASYTGSKLNRPLGIFSNIDPDIQSKVQDAIYTIGQFTHGDGYKSIKDLYPNINYNDVAANEQFLNAFGLDPKLATNPKAMENLAEYYNLQQSSSLRVFDNVKKSRDLEDFSLVTHAPYGGTSSGGGGNSTLISGGHAFELPYHSVAQFPITNNPQKVTTPLSLLQEVAAKSENAPLSTLLDDSSLNQLQTILKTKLSNTTTLREIHDQLGYLNDPKITEQVGKILNINGVYGNAYGGHYFGRYSKTPLSNSYRIVNTSESVPQVNYEMGRLLKSYLGNGSEHQLPEMTKFIDDAMQTYRQFESGQITSKPGYRFFPNDLEKRKAFWSEIKAISDRESQLYRRRDKSSEMWRKYSARKKAVKKYQTAIALGAPVGGAFATLLLGAINDSKNNKLRDQYRKDYFDSEEYKNSYAAKTLTHPDSSIKARIQAHDEKWENLLDYAKRKEQERKNKK